MPRPRLRRRDLFWLLLLVVSGWKITFDPAAVFGIKGRGRLETGYAADLFLFEPGADLPQLLVLLVLDATTGQNGLMQAKAFAEVAQVTGIVLTKVDGTAKGGIVYSVQKELGIPVKLIGFGEGINDFAFFEADEFARGLVG